MTTDASFQTLPPAPVTTEATGLSQEQLSQLLLKTLYFSGELAGTELARRLGLPFRVLETSMEAIRDRRHCEIVGGAMVGGGSFRYRITDLGRSAAAMYLEQNHYVGVAPVPLAQYQTYMADFGRARRPKVSPADVRRAFAHLVLDDAVLDEVGPAVNGNHSIFIYGQPGNGKTAIATGIRRLLSGDIAVPHALDIEGHVVRVFDPVTHEAVADAQEAHDEGLELDVSSDERWVRCRRPAVMTGGELILDSLDLSFEPRLGFYRAPVQLLANGGLLVIDDFGRQRCSPRDLLNRWMVPLESRVDYLTLQSGFKFEIPFLVLVAFATNIRPADLVEEAFLRRVQYKVFADSPSRDSFIQIFEECCAERGVAFERPLVEQMLDTYYRPRSLQMRGCQPRDLINHALLLAEYRGHPRVLTAELLTSSCRSYFVEDEPR